MIKKYGIGLLALVIAVGAAAFTTAKPKSMKQNGSMTTYYYRFDGSAGGESTMANWTQLADENAYDNLNCPSGSVKGCKIKNTTNSGSHPTSVPLSGGIPTLTSPNTSVENRN